MIEEIERLRLELHHQRELAKGYKDLLSLLLSPQDVERLRALVEHLPPTPAEPDPED